MQVQRNAAISGIPFHVVGERQGRPAIVVQSTHVGTQASHSGEVRRFLEQLMEVRTTVDRSVIGCLIVDGNIDEDQRALLKDADQDRIVWFDLTQRDPIPQLKADLDRLGVREADAVAGPSAAGVTTPTIGVPVVEDRRIEELQVQLRKLEDQRLAEQKALNEQIAALSNRQSSIRDQSVMTDAGGDDDQARFHLLYTELSKPQSFRARVGHVFRNPRVTTNIVMLAILAICFVIFAPMLAASEREVSEIVLRASYALSFVLLILGVVLFWLRLAKVDQFLDFRARALRQVYIRSRDVAILTFVDDVCAAALNRQGPIYGQRHAEEQLATHYPDLFVDLMSGGNKRPLS